MLARFREWWVYAQGVLLIAVAGVGVPLVVLERLAVVLAGPPTGLLA